MFVLHVGINVKAGQEKDVEKIFSGPFKAAISVQEGFEATHFLRPLEGGAYILSIAFENQQQQQKWVATDLHQRVWPMMERHIAEYSLKIFTAV